MLVIDRRMYTWMDNWYDLSLEDAKRMHDNLQNELKEVKEY